MGQEHAFQAIERHASEAQSLGRAGAGVDQEQALAGDHRDASLSALEHVAQWRSGSADEDAQRVGLEQSGRRAA